MPASPWSPLPTARTWPGARRAAAILTEVGRTSVGTMSDGDFWYATAARMLAPLLFAAAQGRWAMADVVRWVETAEEVEVLDLLTRSGVPEALDAARRPSARRNASEARSSTTVETAPRALRRIRSSLRDDGEMRVTGRADRLLDGPEHPLPVCTGAGPAPADPLFVALLRR